MADYDLLHDGEEIDACVDEVVAARGTSASLGAEIATKQDALTFDSAPTADSSNPVTSAGIKTAVDAKASKSDIFGLGTAIASGDDMDNYKTLGVFYCSTAGIAASLYNCPSSYTFRLEVKTTNGNARFLQTLYEAVPSGSLAGQIAVYRRAYTASGWGNWYKFEGTVVQPVNVPVSLNANLQTMGSPDITLDNPEESEER